MRIIAALVRHGRYEQPASVPSAHLPHPLTPEGESEARELPARLTELARRHGAALHPVLDSSRMLRAWQTARLAASGLSAGGTEFTVEEFDSLAERSLGAAANLTVQEIARVIARDPRCAPLPRGWKVSRDFRLPLQGAESLAEAGERTARHVTERTANLGQGAVMKVFVGHGGAFRHAAVSLGALAEEAAPRLSMWHCSPVLLARTDGGAWSHLDGNWKHRDIRPDDTEGAD
jgi:2,3-bisphosphoglycerate-dependent phosphoglycerate mutase